MAKPRQQIEDTHDNQGKKSKEKRDTFNLHSDKDLDESYCGEEDPGAALEFLHRDDLGETESH